MAPFIIPAIMGAVKLAEIIFGPKTGDAKKKYVTDSLSLVTDQFLTAGKIKEKVDPTVISMAIDLSVLLMNQAGIFKNSNPDGTPTTPNPTISEETRIQLRSIFASLANNL